MYEYTYDIQSLETNKGLIASISIDLACELDFGNVKFIDNKCCYFSDSSKDGKHVPVDTFFRKGEAGYPGISVDNKFSWMILLRPGYKAEGIKLISPAPPGLRTYTLRPSMQPDGWDYGSYEEEDPTVPWIADFTVTGSIKAPACSLDTAILENDRFEGTGGEKFGINKLLTYATPDKDPIILSSDNETIKFNIFYSKFIKKTDFKANLNGKDISYLFNPAPATNEIVTISTKWKRLNKLILSVPVIRVDEPWNKYRDVMSLKYYDSFDNDVFHIWLN